MAIGWVQTVANGTTSGNSFTITLASVTAGHKIIVALGVVSGTVTFTVSDNIDGTTGWSNVYAPVAAGGSKLYWFEKQASGGEVTLTITPSTTPAAMSGCAWEISGLTTTSSFDKGVQGSQSVSGGTTTSPTSGTLTQANEIALVFNFLNGAYTGTPSITDSIITPTSYDNVAFHATRAWGGDSIKAATTAFTASGTFAASAARVHVINLTTWMAASAITVTPAAVATVTGVGAPTVQAGATLTPGVVATAVGIDQLGVEIAGTVTPSAVATVTGIDAPTITNTGGGSTGFNRGRAGFRRPS